MSNRTSSNAMAKVWKVVACGVGTRAKNLSPPSATWAMTDVIVRAFRRSIPKEQAEYVGHHFGDWPEDAAIVVALHAFPERFTPAEVRHLVEKVAIHVSYHAAALGALFQCDVMVYEGLREGQVGRKAKDSFDDGNARKKVARAQGKQKGPTRRYRQPR